MKNRSDMTQKDLDYYKEMTEEMLVHTYSSEDVGDISMRVILHSLMATYCLGPEALRVLADTMAEHARQMLNALQVARNHPDNRVN